MVFVALGGTTSSVAIPGLVIRMNFLSVIRLVNLLLNSLKP